MKLSFDQLAAELQPLPVETLTKIKGGDGYSGWDYQPWGGIGNGGWQGGGYTWVPGTTTTTGGTYYNSNLGQWLPLPGGGTTTTTGGYWTYTPGNPGGSWTPGYPPSGGTGGGGSTSGPTPLNTGTTPGAVSDPNNVLGSIVSGMQTRAADAAGLITAGGIPAGSGITPADISSYFDTLSQVASEAQAVQNAHISIQVVEAPAGATSGHTHYDPATGTIVMEYMAGANATETLINQVHEMHHVYEFLQGQVSFDKTTGEGGVLTDITDEVSAYQIQHVLETGMSASHVDLTGQPVASGNYTVTAADVIAFGITHNLGYQNMSTTPADINSTAGQALITAAQAGTSPDVFMVP